MKNIPKQLVRLKDYILSNPKTAIKYIAGFFVILFPSIYYLAIYALPKSIPLAQANNQEITLTWTDDNSNENLIIQTDEKTYYGFNEATIYFSITNRSLRKQNINIDVLFRDKSVKLLSLKQIDKKTGENELTINQINNQLNQEKIAKGKYQRKDVRDYTEGGSANDTLGIGQSRFYQAKISYLPRSNGEFYIEAYGDKGAYGQLDPWYSSGWIYRRAFTVTENSGNTLTNYQASTTIDTESIINEGKMASTCDDIRFTDSDGTTLINYWIEDGCNTTDTTIWFKIPELATSSEKTLYFYYGNGEAESQSSATDVWLIYDEFTENTLANYEQYGGTWTWNSGEYVIDPSGNTEAALLDPDIEYSNVLVEVRSKGVDNDGTGAIIRGTGVDTYYACSTDPQNNRCGIALNAGRDGFIKYVSQTQSASDWITTTMYAYGSELYCICQNGEDIKVATTTNATLTNGKIGALSFFNDSSGYVDYIKARQYTYPEPTAGALSYEIGSNIPFTSIIDPDNAAGTDYTSLADWEDAIEADLTLGTTRVFSYSTASGTIPDGTTVIGNTSGATATTTHITASTTSSQIMLVNITNGPFESGETVYIQGESPSENYVVLSDAGNYVIATAECRSSAGTADTDPVTIDGWITDQHDYINIYAVTTSRHSGTWSDIAYRLTSASPLIINESNVRIEGLQIYQDTDTSDLAGIYINPNSQTNDIRISQNIIKGTNSFTTNNHYGIYASSTAKIWNNIIYDFNSSGSIGINAIGANQSYYIYNNTINNIPTGINRTDADVISINNLVQNSTTAYSGTFNANSDYNLSNDNTAPGNNSATSSTVTFLDTSDFHLHYNDTGARNNGTSSPKTDTNLSFTDDIDSQTRHYLWDIGADKYYGTNTPPTISTATATPETLNMGNDITFSATWSDADGETVKIYICSTNSFSTSTQSCTATTYCSDTYDWDSLVNPMTCDYTATYLEEGTKDYYVFVCDDQVSCDSASVSVTVENNFVWDGSESTDWNTPGNWSGNTVPVLGSDVIINGSYTNAPTLDLSSGAVTIGDLTVGSTTASTLTISYGDSSSKKLIVMNGVIIGSSGILNHTANATEQTHIINITAANFTIKSGGVINLDVKGYSSSNGPGQGVDSASYYTGAGGAGHGGEGGTGYSAVGGPVYGSIIEPVTIGSGGGTAHGDTAGAGGGAIKLTVSGVTTIDGLITANGGNGTGNYASAGGGSGGGIWITTGTWAGEGAITANGGTGHSTYSAGGGAGGRIAIYYTSSSSSVSLSAHGGTKSGATDTCIGAAGTIYIKPAGQTYGDLIIDNNNYDNAQDTYTGKTVLDDQSYTFNDIIIRNAGNIDVTSATNITYSNLDWSNSGQLTDNGGTFSPLSDVSSLTVPATSRLFEKYIRTFTDITINGTMTMSNYSSTTALTVTNDVAISSSGILDHAANTTSQNHTVNITAANFTIETGGAVNLSSRGYASSEGPGQGTDSGGAGTGGGGAGYGGEGGDSSSVGGTTYGSIMEPVTIGSGGGKGFGYLAGAGGGAIKLTVSGATTIDGSIIANGGDGTGSTIYGSSGGGSGGSVWITTGSFEGEGVITVNGGAGHYKFSAAGGGGGRIALYYTSSSSSVSLSAHGGTKSGTTDSYIGGAGTIYIKLSGQTYGDLIIDNNDYNNVDITYTGKTPLSDTLTFNSVTISNYGFMELASGSNISCSTLNWNPEGIIMDSGGSFSFFGGSENLEISTTSRLYVNATKSYTFNNVVINGSLTHSNNTDTEQYKINISASGNVNIGSSATINADGKGYAGGYGTGAGSDTGELASGGGHGGKGGGSSEDANAGGDSYGSETAPITLGSGGGNDDAVTGGAAGGGAVKIVATGDMVMNGAISADGSTATNEDAGGGAGGSIWLGCDTLSGSGSLSADGGDPQDPNSGGGAGGRIALIFNTNDAEFSTISVAGGGTNYAGEDGTTYPGAYPIITTQATTNIVIGSATGNGTISYLGMSGDIIDYGHLWGTSSNLVLVPSQAPIAHWNMNDDTTNTIVMDEMASYDGVSIRNTSLMSDTGKINNSLTFNGSSDYIEIGDELNSLSLPVSVSAWIYMTDVDSGGTIFHSDCNTETVPANSGNYYGFWFGISKTNISIQYGDGTGSASTDRRSISATYTFPANQWVYVAGIVRGATDMSLYIDGVDVGGTYSGSGGNMVHNAYPVRIGVNGKYGPTYFGGKIDELRLYNYDLSLNEIAALYNRGIGVETLYTANYYTSYGPRSTTGSFTSSLTDLPLETTYYIRAYAITEDNVITYGNEISFDTPGVPYRFVPGGEAGIKMIGDVKFK